MNESKGDRPESERGVARLHAADTAVTPVRDLGAVQIEFVDGNGRDCTVRLEHSHLVGLIIRLIEALPSVDGSLSAPERMREAQLLLRALIEPRGRKARWVAKRLGIGDSAISLWRSGKAVPTQARLNQLRELVKSIVRPG
jgi:hypothetical protein